MSRLHQSIFYLINKNIQNAEHKPSISVVHFRCANACAGSEFSASINFRDSSSNVSLWPTDQALAATPPVTIAITANRIVVDTVTNA